MIPTGLDCIRYVKGRCAVVACGKPLPKYRRKWCSDACSRWWLENHVWTFARTKALERDGHTCVRCGVTLEQLRKQHFARWLEVNHVVPRNGEGYGNGCWNHVDGLESLCHACHTWKGLNPSVTPVTWWRRPGRPRTPTAKLSVLMEK